MARGLSLTNLHQSPGFEHVAQCFSAAWKTEENMSGRDICVFKPTGGHKSAQMRWSSSGSRGLFPACVGALEEPHGALLGTGLVFAHDAWDRQRPRVQNLVEVGRGAKNIWLWLKKPVPKWNPGKWNQGLKPA